MGRDSEQTLRERKDIGFLNENDLDSSYSPIRPCFVQEASFQETYFIPNEQILQAFERINDYFSADSERDSDARHFLALASYTLSHL